MLKKRFIHVIKKSLWLSFFVLPSAFSYSPGDTNSETPPAYDEAKLALVASQFPASQAPEKEAYKKRIKAALNSTVPVLMLDDITEPLERTAQRVLLKDERIKQSAFDPATKKALRTEVMSIKPALPGDRVGTDGRCWKGGCYRINLYNFFFNASISALVDAKNEVVVSIDSLPESQPELSERLERLAIAIAKHEPAVQLEIEKHLSALGEDAKAADVLPVMASTKSALRNTLCERSRHLCVAPTYVLGDKALWVIVDLTDMKVAGLRWTTVGNAGPPTIVTERILENEYVYKNYCEQVNQLSRDGWAFDYHITTSDGLRLANATYKGKSVFESAKVVDWHVSYSRKDTFGFSDATGCPMYSSAVVVAFEGPRVETIVENGKEVGFHITQEFQQHSWPAPCNYRYEERYEFYKDGRYRVAMVSHGRGCGSYGTYRPVFRMALGKPSENSQYQVRRWADAWKPVEAESWVRQKEPARLAEQRFSHQIVDDNGQGFLLEPSAGQFNDGGRGDNAYIYVTVNHADKDEGERDLVTLGACCNTGHEQGPEQFMQPAETLSNQSLVLWYVPQMKNDGRKGQEYCWAENQVVDGVLKTKTWPCVAGPMFVPLTTGAN